MIDSAGDTFTTAFNGTKIGEYEDTNGYATKRIVHGACAAAAIYRRAMLELIGFLDDDFFFNHEDTDLNFRAWLAGWKCVFVPEAIAYHRVSASRGTYSDFSVYYYARNIEWVWIKNVPFALILRYLPQRILYEISSFAYFCIVKGKFRPFLRGKVHAMLNLPKMLVKRGKIQHLVTLRHEQIAEGLEPISHYLRVRIRNSRMQRNANR